MSRDQTSVARLASAVSELRHIQVSAQHVSLQIVAAAMHPIIWLLFPYGCQTRSSSGCRPVAS